MPKPLTILHTEVSRRWGGQESRVFEECRWMRSRGHRTVLAAPAGSLVAQRASAAGIELVPMPFLRSTLGGDLLRMRRLLRNLRPDVLNTHGNLDSKTSLLAALNLHIPLLIRSRHSIPPVSRSPWNYLFYGRLCHLVFSTAECSRLQLIRDLKLDPERVFTVASGIQPPQQLPTQPAARQSLLQELRLPQGSRLVGYVGRLRENKGLQCLLQAWVTVRKQRPDCHLVLVGSGSFLDPLKRDTTRLGLDGAVHLTGHRDDPWPWYRGFDCHVSPTPEFEGISQAARQAMFAGCPVIASNIGGLAEIIRHGDTGLLVPPNQPGALADAILQVFADPDAAARRATAALAYVHPEHTLDRMGERTLAIYARHLPPGRLAD